MRWPRAGTVGPAAAGEFLLLARRRGRGRRGRAGSLLLSRRTADPVLETVIALVTPYAAYVLAESATSGVTAVVVAGLWSAPGQLRLTAHVRLQVQAVYAVVVFLLESVVFGVIGLELPALVEELPTGSRWWPVQALARRGAAGAGCWDAAVDARGAAGRGGGAAAWRAAGVVRGPGPVG